MIVVRVPGTPTSEEGGGHPSWLAREAGAGVLWRHTVGESRQREHALLLWAARTDPAGEPAEQLRVLSRGEVDWTYVLRKAWEHGIVALLYRSLNRSCADTVAPTALDQFRAVNFNLGASIHFRVRQLHSILGWLGEHGITAVPFKGPALGAFAYGEVALRKPGDLDLLIQRRDFEKARDILVGQGYQSRVERRREAWYLRTRGSSTFVHSEGNVDVHWTLEQRSFDSMPFGYRFDMRQVWERRIPIHLEGKEIASLCTEDLLLFLCLHGMKHTWSRLYLLCDLAELSARHRIDWQRLFQEVEQQHSERIIYPGLLLAHAVLGAPLPEGAVRRMRHDPLVGEITRQLATWLFDPSTSATGSEYHRFRASLFQSWPQKVRYLLLRGMRKMSKRGETGEA